MATYHYIFLVMLALVFKNYAETVTCSGDCDCTGGENCTLNCNAHNCSQSILTCPNNYDCTINCLGDQSCDTVTINSAGSKNIVLTCTGYNACNDVSLNCPNGYDCSVLCSDGIQTCQYMEVDGTLSNIVDIDCSNDIGSSNNKKCLAATIWCGQECYINCNGTTNGKCNNVILNNEENTVGYILCGINVGCTTQVFGTHSPTIATTIPTTPTPFNLTSNPSTSIPTSKSSTIQPSKYPTPTPSNPTLDPTSDPSTSTTTTVDPTHISSNPTNTPTDVQTSTHIYSSAETTTITVVTSDGGDSTIKNDEDDSSWQLIVIALCITFVLLLGIVIGGVFCYKKKKMDNMTNSIKQSQMVDISSVSTDIKQEYNAKKQFNNNFEPGSIDNVIGIDDDKNDEMDDVKLMDDKIDADFEREKLKLWLTEDVKLPRYFNNFIENGYDSLDIIKNIEDRNYLKEIGIDLAGHQMKLMNDIKILQTPIDSVTEGGTTKL